MLRSNAHVQDLFPFTPVFRPDLPAKTRTFYRSLWLELKRQRAELLRGTIQELPPSFDAALVSDLLDQASIGQEQELTLRVRERYGEKLRQIDLALHLMEHRRYGLCGRCGQEIPFARLRVQPAASYCVRCQTLAETPRSSTTPIQHSHT